MTPKTPWAASWYLLSLETSSSYTRVELLKQCQSSSVLFSHSCFLILFIVEIQQKMVFFQITDGRNELTTICVWKKISLLRLVLWGWFIHCIPFYFNPQTTYWISGNRSFMVNEEAAYFYMCTELRHSMRMGYTRHGLTTMSRWDLTLTFMHYICFGSLSLRWK